MKEKIEVETWNVKVGRKYYSFEYQIWRNGKSIGWGTYDSSHSRAPQTMRKKLNNGTATELIIERYL